MPLGAPSINTALMLTSDVQSQNHVERRRRWRSAVCERALIGMTARLAAKADVQRGPQAGEACLSSHVMSPDS
jgi:hypothetical protein